MSSLALCIVLRTVILADGAADYATAYRQTMADGKPLVVLVGADWCPGCRTMKYSVLPGMQARGQFHGVHLAYVSVDHQRELADRLMSGGTIPQLIVFSRRNGKWHREQLIGAVDAEAVQAMIGRATDASRPVATKGSRGTSAAGN